MKNFVVQSINRPFIEFFKAFSTDTNPSDPIGIFVTHQGPKSPEKYRKDLLNWQGDEDWQMKDSQIGGLLKCVAMKSLTKEMMKMMIMMKKKMKSNES